MVQKGFNGQGGGKHKVLWGSYDLVAVSGLKANGFSAYGRMNNKAGVTMIGSLLESMESFSKGNECPRLPPSGGNRGYHNSISTRRSGFKGLERLNIRCGRWYWCIITIPCLSDFSPKTILLDTAAADTIFLPARKATFPR